MQNKQTNFGLVSIIMPTYKQTELLYKAVESVMKQTYQNIELIIIDDNKEEIFKNSNKNYFDKLNNSKIVYIQNEQNLGSTATRNKGIFLANGKYITFLDDDDIYVPFKIEKQVVQMEQEDADVSVCNLILKNEKGKIVDKRQRKYLSRKEPLLVAHLKYHITGTDTMMFKSEFLKSIGGFDEENLGDEFYLMLKALEKKPKFIHINYDGVIALVHSQTGLSSGDNKIKAEKMLLNFQTKYFDVLKKKDIRYIKMRHNVVLATAHKKNKEFVKCIGYLFKSFFTDMIGFVNIFIGKDR